MGYREPRPIQAQAIGPAIGDRDLIGLAPTGTGKTAAFLSPIAHHLLHSPPPSDGKRKVDSTRRLRAMVLCPTRELAVQVEKECSRIIAGTVLRSACAYGKVGMQSQREAISCGIDVLVATPGRVRELLDAEALTLAHIRHIAIDEADRMLDMGFLPQVAAIVEAIPPERQMMLFSATMPEAVEDLARRFLTSPVRIEIGRHTTPVAHVQQHLVAIEQRDKVALLLKMLPKPPVIRNEAAGRAEKARSAALKRAPARVPSSVLIFCRTRRRVGWVGAALQRHGIACGMIHGDRTQAQRLRAIDQLSTGKLHVIVSTDVAARGLHVPTIRAVINYDVPPDAEEYVHRIGRAAHGGGAGEAWTLLAVSDHERWNGIRRQLDLAIEPEPAGEFEPVSPGGNRAPAKRGGARPMEPTGKIRRGASGKRPPRRPQREKRSRKSRPIPKEERPGGGVRRPGSSDQE